MQSAENPGTQSAARDAIEARLRSEAEQFVRRRFCDAPLQPILEALTQGAAGGPDPGRAGGIAPGVMAHLQKALRRERQKSRLGHAGYDFNRHLALHQAIRRLSK